MNPQTQQLIGRAIEYFQNGSPAQAEEILVRILNTQSNNLPALEILGLIKASQGHHLESAKLLKKAVKLNPQNPATQYNLAKALSESKDYVGSLIHHEKALQLTPNNPDGWLNYGQTLAKLKRSDQALTAFNKALAINPNYVEAWYNKALGRAEAQDHDEAVSCYQKVIELQPTHEKALIDLSTSLGVLKRYEEAIQCCDQALILRPQYPEAWLNKGSAYSELKQFEKALACYDQALAIKHDYADAWYSKGIALEKLNRHEEALTCYDKAIGLEPKHAKAWVSKSLSFGEIQNFEAAIFCCDQALILQPQYPEAWLNKGSAYSELKQFEKALACYDQALAIKHDYADAWYSKGAALKKMHQYQDALVCLNQAVSLKPEFPVAWLHMADILGNEEKYEAAIQAYKNLLSQDSEVEFAMGNMIHFMQKIGDWTNFEQEILNIGNQIKLDKKVVVPLAFCAMLDDPSLQLNTSKISAGLMPKSEYVQNHFLGPIEKYTNSKIKIAYFSADFNEHPVSYLMAELFELHDRNQFEVFAFSLKRANGSPMRDRLISIFDHFIDVDEKSDQEITKLARDLKIDIAIDLNGHTQNYRSRIFAYRAAPIQVNYLGYPGTMGAEYMDYIIADRIVIPEEYQEYYLEKKVYLPNSYMVDDSTRIPSSKPFSRSDFNLPNDAIVFCCFNNSYKFTPTRVSSFAKILLGTPNSVMWITENNASFRKNLAAEFSKLGVTDERIIFAGRVDPLADHLARYRLADLFLDTSPYNAHTTGLDSLKAGVPVITLAGKSFASRVGASLLTAIDLPELIVHSEEAFIELASKLGNDPKALNVLKAKLIVNYKNTPLFDSKLYCKHLEMAYQEIYRRSINNLPPANIDIKQ